MPVNMQPVTPWILDFLKVDEEELAMKIFDGDDDEYHLGHKLIEFWETGNIGPVISIILKFNRHYRYLQEGSNLAT